MRVFKRNVNLKGQIILYKDVMGSKSKNLEPPRSKTLLLSSRGILSRHRHLLLDFTSLISNSLKESKFDSKKNLNDILELCELNDCDRVIFFEARRKEDLYLWLSSINGLTFKFYVSNIHTMEELSFTGNSIMGISPILSFDLVFDSTHNLRLVKDVLIKSFGLPINHVSTVDKTCSDRIYQISYLDNKIWFRNYQIIKHDVGTIDLVEIGPRFVLTLLKVFKEGFHGPTLFSNDTFITPTSLHSILKQRSQLVKHSNRSFKLKQTKSFSVPKDTTESVFSGMVSISDPE